MKEEKWLEGGSSTGRDPRAAVEGPWYTTIGPRSRVHGLRLILLLVALLSSSADAAPNDAPRLPVTEPWHRGLYAWMQSLKVDDLAIPAQVPVWDGTYTSTSELANLYMGTSLLNVTNPVFPNMVMKGESRWFVLDDGNGAGVEGSGTVRYARFPNGAAYWYQVSMPMRDGGQGNPYYRHAGLCNRVLVSTAVDLIMTDYWHDQQRNPWGTSVWAKDDPRFLGGLMNAWAYAYGVCRNELTPENRAPFEAGLREMAQKLIDQNPTRHTPNMQTRVVSAMAHLYKAVDDPTIKDLALRTARKYLFGYEDGVLEKKHRFPQSLFYPAGYVQEGFSPETTYNGVSLYHLTEARAVTDGDPAWDFLDEPLRRMSDFRSYQLFVEPDGNLEGPSAYAGRTGAAWDKLQAGHPWRDLTLSGLYVEARPYGRMLENPQGMVRRIFNQFSPGGRMAQHFLRANSSEVPPFEIDHDHHWPSYVPYAPAGDWYEEVYAAQQNRDESIFLPFMREGYYFDRSFADDFWSYKSNDGKQDFGFFVESEADGGTYGGYRGGSLQAFWTETAGLVVLGRKNKDSRQWKQIEQWATNHVWGRTSNGYFSSGVERKRDVEYGDGEVAVSGPLDSNAQQSPVELSLTTIFTAIDDGIRITHELTGNRSNVQELWATLPINLRHCNESRNRGPQCGMPDSEIEYRDGDRWSTLGTDLVTTSRLRITRRFGSPRHAYIELDAPRRVRLSSEPFQQTYQAANRVQPVHIEIGDRGEVSYSVVTREP